MTIIRQVIILAFAVILSIECTGTVVRLRDGSTVNGIIISRNDTNCVLRTEKGMKTIPWCSMKNTSIEKLHPELFSRLMLKKGMVNIKGLWVTPKEAENMKEILLRSILLGVKTKVKKGSWSYEYPEAKKNIWGNKYPGRICNGLVTIELVNLSPYESYVLTVQIKDILKGAKGKDIVYKPSVYMKYRTDRTGRYTGEATLTNTTWIYGFYTNEVTETFTIENRREYMISIKTPGYTEIKYSKKIKRYFNPFRGLESKGFNISIWLNDTLVYKGIHGEIPRYYYVGKL